MAKWTDTLLSDTTSVEPAAPTDGAQKKNRWSDALLDDTAPVAPKNEVVDDVSKAAGVGAIARASLAPDDKIKIKRYAESFKQPESDFTIIDGDIVRKLPGTDQYAKVQASISGAEGPIDAAKRAMGWVASGAGPAIPAVTGAVGAVGAGLLTAPATGGVGSVPAAMAGGAVFASAGEVARQKLDAALAPEGKEAPMDVENVLWQGAAGGAGPLLDKAVRVGAARVAPVLKKAIADELPEAAMVAREAITEGTKNVASSFGLSPRVVDALRTHITGKEAELDQLRKEALELGIELSLGQVTGSAAVQQAERQLLRQPETVQSVVDLRQAQNNIQVPKAVKGVLDNVAPDKAPGQQVDEFRNAADHVVKKEIGERSDMADYMYEPLFKGKSIAPLEDQFRTAVMQITAEKGQIAKQMKNLEKLHPGAISGTAKPINPAAQAKNAEIKAQYDELAERASEVEEARVSFLERFKQAQADKTAGAPGAVWTPRIQQFLDDPIGKAGLARGLEIQRLEALEKGVPFKPTDYAIVDMGEDGVTPVVGAVPNMRLLNAWKKGLDAIIESETKEGRLTERGKAVYGAKKAFLKEVDAIIPEYSEARAKFGTDSDAIDAIKEGGVGFINKMKGPDRQTMITRIFSGQNLMPDDVAEMRRQFVYAGKLNEWNGGVRSYIANALADAVAPQKQGGEATNVAGTLYKTLFEERQANVLKAALGGSANDTVIAQWNKLGRVLKAASHQLPEGAATATDIGAPGLAKRSVQAANLVFRPEAVSAELLSGLEKMQDPKEALKLAETLLTPEGDKLLKAIQPTTPGTPKADSILLQMMTQAGLITAAGQAGQKADEGRRE